MSGRLFDGAEMSRALRRIFVEGDVFEVRVLGAVTSEHSRPHTESGYFDYGHISDIPQSLGHIRSCKGVYYTPNPVSPALLARRCNRIAMAGDGDTTKDANVVSRRWMLVDCDPVRTDGVTGISATDEERERSARKADEVMSALALDGWGEPIVCDSGNGTHLMYYLGDNPPDSVPDDFRSALETLASDFGDAGCEIDRKVFNLSRIWRLPGCLNCKGEDMPERPHRMCRVVTMPEKLKANGIGQVSRLAGYSRRLAESAVAEPDFRERFDIDEWIAGHCRDVMEPREWNGGRKWVFRVCPFNHEHADRSAVIVQCADGRIGFTCHHNGCSGNDWHRLRDLLEPGWRESRARPSVVPGVDISGIASPRTETELVVHEAAKPIQAAGADEVDEYFDSRMADEGCPWRLVTEEDVLKAIDGTYLGRLNDIYASVTEPRLPVASSLLKALVTIGCCLTCEADDAELNKRWGGNMGGAYLSGVMRAKTYINTGGGQLMNFYCLLIGNSGSGKDVGHLTNMFSNFPNPSARQGAPNQTFMIGSNGSPEGMAESLMTIPNGLMILSEMENFFDERHWQRKMMTFLTESWDIGFFNQVLAGRQRGTNYCAPNAIGNIQNEVFRELATEHLINTGAFSRWLIAMMPEEERFFGRPAKFDMPDTLKRMKAITDVFLGKTGVVDVPQGYSDGFYDMLANRMDAKMDATWTRYVNMYYPRIAAILAVTDDPATHVETLAVTDEAFKRARTLILWFIANAERAIGSVDDSDNPEARIIGKVADNVYKAIVSLYEKTGMPVMKSAISRFGIRADGGIKSTSRQRTVAIEELMEINAIKMQDGGFVPNGKRCLKKQHQAELGKNKKNG